MTSPEHIRKEVLDYLQQQGFPADLPLPVLDETRLRSPREVAERIIILYALVGLAHDASPRKLRKWLTENNIYPKMHPSERALFDGSELSEQQLTDVSWLKEALYTLAWSGGLVEDEEFGLPFKDSLLDKVFPLMPPEVEVADFLDSLALLPEEKIFFQADLHYCLHWISRHHKIWGTLKAPRRLNTDVLVERRRAFEWLIDSAAPWEEVTLDT